MISAVSKYGAATSAKRIISTAEIEKLAATMQFGPPSPNSSPNAARSSSVNPVVPTTAWMPCIASQGTVRRAESATVKSTTTSAPASANALGSAEIVRPSIVVPAAPGSTAATSSRSGSSATARQTVAPIRPPAPLTPTFTGHRPSLGSSRRR